MQTHPPGRSKDIHSKHCGIKTTCSKLSRENKLRTLGSALPRIQPSWFTQARLGLHGSRACSIPLLPKPPRRLAWDPALLNHTGKTRNQSISVMLQLNQEDPEGATALVPLLDCAPRQVYRGAVNAQMAYSPSPFVVSPEPLRSLSTKQDAQVVPPGH